MPIYEIFGLTAQASARWQQAGQKMDASANQLQK
jgi:hypothetical protein